MKILPTIFYIGLVTSALQVSADTTGFISIPATAFLPENSINNYSYTTSYWGTNRNFHGRVYAPVNLPHKSVVTSFLCGSKAESVSTADITYFKLHRNDPQQKNTSMASLDSNNFRDGAYHFLKTEFILESRIDNSRYNYYISAFAYGHGNVNFCRIEYQIIPPEIREVRKP